MSARMAVMVLILLAATPGLLPAQTSAEVQTATTPESPVTRAGSAGQGAAAGAPGVVPGGAAGCCGHNCHTQGCFLYKVWVWATYCPKERLGCCRGFCNSCQYKGALPFYLFFLNPKCMEGSGVHPTFANECFRGCREPGHLHP